MLKTRHILIAALAGAMLLACAMPAIAGQDLGATVHFKGKRAGDGTLLHKGGRSYTLIACDVLKDGYGVWAWAKSDDGAFDTHEVRDTGGAKKTSGTKGCDVENVTLNGDVPRLTVCMVDQDGKHARGKPDCSERSAGDS